MEYLNSIIESTYTLCTYFIQIREFQVIYIRNIYNNPSQLLIWAIDKFPIFTHNQIKNKMLLLVDFYLITLKIIKQIRSFVIKVWYFLFKYKKLVLISCIQIRFSNSKRIQWKFHLYSLYFLNRFSLLSTHNLYSSSSYEQ